jgi:hypothetical protein
MNSALATAGTMLTAKTVQHSKHSQQEVDIQVLGHSSTMNGALATAGTMLTATCQQTTQHSKHSKQSG